MPKPISVGLKTKPSMAWECELAGVMVDKCLSITCNMLIRINMIYEIEKHGLSNLSISQYVFESYQSFKNQILIKLQNNLLDDMGVVLWI